LATTFVTALTLACEYCDEELPRPTPWDHRRSCLLPTDCETTPGKIDTESQAVCTIAGQAELWWQHRPGAMQYLSSLAHHHVREFGPVFDAEQRPGRVELPVAQRLCAAGAYDSRLGGGCGSSKAR
jgi:hypothetical protein